MLTLRAIQAKFGDCIILENSADGVTTRLLIDGGPADCYDKHLRPELLEIENGGGRLDLVMLSHVDTDHVTGLLDFFAELESTPSPAKPLISVAALWHNSFDETVDPTGEIQARVHAVAAQAKAAGAPMQLLGAEVNGIGEGNKLRFDALRLKLPLNAGFKKGLILLRKGQTAVKLGKLKLTVIGPTKASLNRLRDDWVDWLEKQEAGGGITGPQAANPDDSVPNLSSILVLAEAGGKSVLLTGDGLDKDIVSGLQRVKATKKPIHVNVLKMPHHGSERNVDAAFFDKITADSYVFSANGKDGNPDLPTLLWLVDAAKRQKRKIKVVVTNNPASVKKLVVQRPPASIGYELQLLKADEHSIGVTA